MAIGEYKLAVQRGSVGAYALVRLEAVVHDGPLVVETDAIETRWRAAAVFGVTYAQERLRRVGFDEALCVRILEVGWMHSDTTGMAVAMAAYHAACAAFGQPADPGVRRRDDGIYEFPA